MADSPNSKRQRIGRLISSHYIENFSETNILVSTEDERTASQLIHCLEEQDELYELHTHLLGMGNASFWIHSILTDQAKLPPQTDFLSNDRIRKHLGPLVWNKQVHKFIDQSETKQFFDELCTGEKLNDVFSSYRYKMFKHLQSEDFFKNLKRHDLTFKDHFSYDIIFSIEKLCYALELSPTQSKDTIQAMIEEKLGVYTRNDWQERKFFKYWIIFNARDQTFEVVYGMRAEDLRLLIGGAKPINQLTDPAQRDARAHIINAFSMMNADGSEPRSIDFHSFRGSFTPQFYPRRFALKDSIYSQRLDFLALLLRNALHRFSTCLPPIKYCEFSVGCGDLSRAWVLDVLSTFCKSKSLAGTFKTLVNNGCFPWLKTYCVNQDIDYRFLAGFNRTISKVSKGYSTDDALTFLLELPHCAIHRMLREFYNSDNRRPTTLFTEHVQQLERLKKKAYEDRNFFYWVVGFDLFGDELGYPYCPFVAYEFLDFFQEARKHNANFGVRIHCAENVPFIRPELPGYRLFVAHMYIVYRCLDFLKQKLGHSIRVGHGIAFDILLSIKNYTYRKSSVLVAQMQNARRLLSSIPFEVNITSNFYLLGDAIRNTTNSKPLHVLKQFDIPIVLSTDDDGIWPIDRCPLGHQGHHSLAAEYCRAITTSFITEENQLKIMTQGAKRFCFKDKKELAQSVAKYSQNNENKSFPTEVVLHPDVFRTLLPRAQNKKGQILSNCKCIKYYENIYGTETVDSNKYNRNGWKEHCGLIAPVAVACFYLTRLLPFKQFKKECDVLFKDRCNVEEIFKVCEYVYSYLMSDAPGQAVRMQVQVNNRDYLFFSEHSNNFKESPDFFLNIIEKFLTSCTEKAVVFGFLPCIHLSNPQIRLNVENIDKKLENKNVKVCIHTNGNKDTIPPDYTSERIYINDKPSRRTDPDEKLVECMIYAVCPHSSAATSALIFLAKHINDSIVFSPQHTLLRTLIVPFLPLRYGYSADDDETNIKTAFLDKYALSSTKLKSKIVVKKKRICKVLFDSSLNFLYSEVKYAEQIDIKDLAEKVHVEEETFVEILRLLCKSIDEFDLWPRSFVIIEKTSDYESYLKIVNENRNKVPVPIIEIENNMLLICNSADIYETSSPKRKSAYLWSLAACYNPPLNPGRSPYEYPLKKWVESIVRIEIETLNKKFGPHTWEEFLYKVLMSARKYAWFWYTVNSWCDVICYAFQNVTDKKRLAAFKKFLNEKNRIDKFKTLVNNTDRYRLGNRWQKDIINSHEANKYLRKLLE
ncbi:unnamed protein product [Adineta ricciae]|uniref:Adenosine deaminase domain-containing protein n=1 Tax=Adineta ricciae TaxID=249248 RepID=A0A814M0I9_ADIRI|nr:unnamed protein product [Adineta ricciae]